MGFIDKYPYTDFHELNLDWILKAIRELGIKMDEFEAVNKITFSGAWDITSQYPAWTVVDDNNIGYISVQPVPAGILLNNTDYWRVITDYSSQIAGMQAAIIALQNTVGDASSGLVKQTNDNTSAIGTIQTNVGTLQTTVGNASSGLVKQTNDNTSAIGTLQTNVGNLQTTVGNASSGLVKQTNDNTSAISAINAKLAAGKWLFLGDSYENYGQWYAKVINSLGLTDNVDSFYAGVSGHGFTSSGGLWVSDMINFCAGRTDLAEFKHVVIVGGLNDSTPAAVQNDAASLRTAINSFFASTRARMQNATICAAFVGSGLSDSVNLSGRTAINRHTACQVYRDEFTKNKGVFLRNCEFSLYSESLFNSDGVHPNSYGANIIANAVAEAIINGSSSSVTGDYETTVDTQFSSSGVAGWMHCFRGVKNTVDNGRSRMVLRNTVCQLVGGAFTIGATASDIGKIPPSCFVRNSQPIPCKIQRSWSGGFQSITGYCQLIDGHLYVASDELRQGPSYASLTFAANDRFDLGDLTFDEFTMLTQ